MAAPIVYDNEAAFVAATDPEAFVDFNDVKPVSFTGSSASVGNMTFSGPFHPNHPNATGLVNYIGGKGPDKATIDDTIAVNGFSMPGASMRIDFLAPVTSFGAYFSDLGDDDKTTLINFLDADDTSIGKILVEGFDDQNLIFRGIDLAGPAASAIEFVSLFAPDDLEAFAMDNVYFSTGRGINPAPVPLPASALLFLAGAGVFAAMKRKRA
jgi:hypothetical protein